ENYGWLYDEKDNAFYLTTTGDTLRIVSKKDDSYVFVDKLTIPNSIEQMSTLNSDGDNVQINEDIVVHVVFEAVQSTLPIQKANIENLRDYFSLNATQYENGFTSQNGFITNCDSLQETITLPKTVGNDYVLGIKENAFQNTNIKQIIIPASYIYFDDNCFSNLVNLNFVAIKNHINIVLKANTFTPNSGLEIYVPTQMMKKITENYSTFAYATSFKQATSLTSSNLTDVPTTTQYVYCEDITSFEGNLSALTSLKVADFPVLESINDDMFSGLTSLVSVECPNAKIVGKRAFNGCIKLVNVVLDKKVQEIGDSSFFGCSNLQEANFTKTLSVIPDQAFRGCSSLTKIVINGENAEIKNAGFYGCGKLKSVSINSLSVCEDYSFGECSSLKWFFVQGANNLSVSDKTFSRTTGTTNQNLNIVFANSATKNDFETKTPLFASQTMLVNISKGELTKFEGNVKNLDLTDFNQIEKITKIGNDAFKNNTTLLSLVLPYSVKSLGNNVFDGAENFTK
ncbi:MAG: leucine-rich repeat protein, partial [Christensenellales bacterium]